MGKQKSFPDLLKEVRKMNKKGILMHPAVWIVIAFILGAAVMWYLMKNGMIPLG